jgi:hypothetical protein
LQAASAWAMPSAASARTAWSPGRSICWPVSCFLSRVNGPGVPAGLIVAGSVIGTILAYIPEWLGLLHFPLRGAVTPVVELLYDKDCPNASETRKNLERAFAIVGLSPSWMERELSSPETRPQARAFGSPTVLVNGRDVAGCGPGDAASCRIYETAGRRSGTPSTELIVNALASTCRPRPSG